MLCPGIIKLSRASMFADFMRHDQYSPNVWFKASRNVHTNGNHMRFKPIMQDGPQCEFGSEISRGNSKINKRATCLASIGACKRHIRRKHHSSKELAPCTASHFLGTSIKVTYNEPRNSCCHDASQGLLGPLLVWTRANFKVGVQV